MATQQTTHQRKAAVATRWSYSSCLAIFLLALFVFAGCSLSSKTTVDTLEDSFVQNANGQAGLGLVQVDWVTIGPIKGRDQILGAFGLLGAVTSLALQSAEDSDNYEVETESLALYQKDVPYLKQRLAEQTRFRFMNDDALEQIDAVEYSRGVRSKRFWGPSAPSDETVEAYFKDADHQYALYVINWGGISGNNDILFVNTTWGVLDRNGVEVVSVFTRHVGKQVDRNTIQTSEVVEELSDLFRKNFEEFLLVMNGKKPLNGSS